MSGGHKSYEYARRFYDQGSDRSIRQEDRRKVSDSMALLDDNLLVTDKGFISFAAPRTSRSRRGLIAAKLMKPRSELNGNRVWLFNGFCSAARLGMGVLE